MFNFQAGSLESIQFLRALNEKAAELNQLFMSKVVRNILLFKFERVKILGYFLLILYLVHLISISLYPHKWLVFIWLIIYTVQEGRLTYMLWNGSPKDLFYEMFTFWNTMDLMRIASLLCHFICADNSNVSEDGNKKKKHEISSDCVYSACLKSA